MSQNVEGVYSCPQCRGCVQLSTIEVYKRNHNNYQVLSSIRCSSLTEVTSHLTKKVLSCPYFFWNSAAVASPFLLCTSARQTCKTKGSQGLASIMILYSLTHHNKMSWKSLVLNLRWLQHRKRKVKKKKKKKNGEEKKKKPEKTTTTGGWGGGGGGGGGGVMFHCGFINIIKFFYIYIKLANLKLSTKQAIKDVALKLWKLFCCVFHDDCQISSLYDNGC